MTAAILLVQNPDSSVDDAIQRIKDIRPALRCNREQMDTLDRFAQQQTDAREADEGA